MLQTQKDERSTYTVFTVCMHIIHLNSIREQEGKIGVSKPSNSKGWGISVPFSVSTLFCSFHFKISYFGSPSSVKSNVVWLKATFDLVEFGMDYIRIFMPVINANPHLPEGA